MDLVTAHDSCFVVAAVVGISGCASAPEHSGRVSLGAACRGSSQGAGPHITTTIRNDTLQHLSIVAGIIVGDGEHLAQALSLVWKRPDMTEGEMSGTVILDIPAWEVVSTRGP